MKRWVRNALVIACISSAGLVSAAPESTPKENALRVVQGQFASAADEGEFQKAFANVFGNEVKIGNPSDDPVNGVAAANDYFGYSVAFAGDTALVGADHDDIGANTDQGSIYVFTRSGTTWSQQAKLIAADGAAGDLFGSSVALAGDTALVGASRGGVGTYRGSAYVFTRSGTVWSQQAKLSAADGATNDYFGISVALVGDTAVVGAYQDDIGSNLEQGSAYVFTRSATMWSQQARLSAADGAAGDLFGRSVALAGDTVLVGAYGDGIGANAGQGSAYVFTRNGALWSQQARLTASDGATNDLFGISVALVGDTAVVGAHQDDIGANSNQGSAYVFTRNGTVWNQQAKLSAADGATNDYFGISVALAGDTALVGAFRDDIGVNTDQGSAYVFTRSGTLWSQQAKLSAGDGAASDSFGVSVALAGDTALVGSYLDDIGANSNQGSAYVFTRSGTLWGPPVKVFVAAEASANDQFGYSVALDADTALVGSYLDDIGANFNQGSAYVFIRSGTLWSLQARLIASDGAPGEGFGTSVALAADTALVGAWGDSVGGANTQKGSVYVFARSGSVWSEQAKLTAADGANGDAFGYSVALAGDTALVGARDDGIGPSDADQGSAYVFTRNGSLWSQQAKLLATDAAAIQRFGTSVALSGDTALVGTEGDPSGANTLQGAAYVFTRSGTVWSQQAKLSAGDGAAGDFFGRSVALAGDTALVGAEGDDIGANLNQGSAYVFTRNGTVWSQQAKLIASDGAYDNFGSSVALAGDIALVGAFRDDIGVNTDQGSAYVFMRSETLWSEHAKITAGDGAADDQFGFSVALAGDTVLIGANFDDSVGPFGSPNVGSVYFNDTTPGADLQVTKTNHRDGLFDGEQSIYAIVVTNAGPNAVSGATLTDMLPNTLINGSWMCVQAASNATCPTPDAGADNLNTTINLGVSQYLSFDVMAEVDGNVGAFVTNTASVTVPGGTTPINTSNDSATDQDLILPILPINLFADDFE